MVVSGFTGLRALCQSGHRPQSATQEARFALESLGRLVLRCTMASCCRKARFCRASSRCGFGLGLAVASRAYSKGGVGVGELDPERGNVSDCAVDGVLRRHRSMLLMFFGQISRSACSGLGITAQSYWMRVVLAYGSGVG